MPQNTQIFPVRVRERRSIPMEPAPTNVMEWTDPPPKRHSEAFMKNLAVAAALVLCAVTLRTGALPEFSPTTEAILTAATDQSLLDDQLGKLSFVSALFPEAVLVFGESKDTLTIPVNGSAVVHTWSKQEPYMTMRTNASEVLSYSSGEVIGVYHGNGSERLVQVLGDNGLSCLYGNLEEVYVSTGDYVSEGETLGVLMRGEDLVLQVYRNGISIDPADYFE